MEEITVDDNNFFIENNHFSINDLNQIRDIIESKTEIIEELKSYITYVNTQENTLHQVEKQKESFKTIYFTKDNKDNNTN